MNIFSPVRPKLYGTPAAISRRLFFTQRGMGLLASSTWWCLIILLLSSGPSVYARTDKLSVYVSIVPQKYFVEKIGGDLVEVSIMVQPGASPATYEPKPRQMARLAGTELYFAIGVPFEKRWLDKIAAVNPRMIVVHTEAGVEKVPMAIPGYQENNGYNGQKHDHEGIKDPHIWLSPPLVMIQARNIFTALVQTDRENTRVYEENYRRFILELVRLDMQIFDLLPPKGCFMVFHPAWGYFARAYGLEQIPVEIEGKEPKPAQLRNLIRLAKERKIKALFVQPEFSTKSAEFVARQIGARVIPVSPLAMNWAANLKQTAQKIHEVMR